MRKEKYVARNMEVTHVAYQTNESNEIKETTLAGSFTRREALEELRGMYEDDESDMLITQVQCVTVETIYCKVKQSAFLALSEYDLSGIELVNIINNYEDGCSVDSLEDALKTYAKTEKALFDFGGCSGLTEEEQTKLKEQLNSIYGFIMLHKTQSGGTTNE